MKDSFGASLGAFVGTMGGCFFMAFALFAAISICCAMTLV